MKNKVLILAALSLLLSSCGNENSSTSSSIEINSYTLTILGGGTVTINQYDNILSKLTNQPTKTGYSITSWTIDGQTVSNTDIYTYNEDKTIEPVFTPNNYLLYFTGLTTTLTVTYDAAIGELPEASGKTGYDGYWSINNIKLTPETIWNYTTNMIASKGYEAKQYVLSFQELPGTTIDVFYNENIGELPAVPNVTAKMTGYWTIDGTEISANTKWLYASNKVAKAKYVQTSDEFATSPDNGASISLNNENVIDLFNNYVYAYGEKYRINHSDQADNKPLTISWTSEEEYAFYRLKIGQKGDLSDGDSYILLDSNFTLKNAFTNTTYYYQIKAYDESETLKSTSLIKTVKIQEGPRPIKITSVGNMRDLGGNATTFAGKKIKQGMIYRSANIDALANSAEGKRTFLNELRIQTDLDIRNEVEAKGRTTSPSGCSKYFQYTGVYYMGGNAGIDVSGSTTQFGKEVAVFADSSNYPIDFHCAIGRDRTGCLSGVLLGLLGVTYEDLCKDYELSLLSKDATQDNGTASGLVNSNFRPFMDYVIANGGSATSLSDKIAYFLTNSCGLTSQQVNNIKAIMLEDK